MVLAHSPPRKAANTRPPDRNRRNLTRISETPTDIITQQTPPPLPTTTSRAGHSRSHSPRSPPPRGRAPVRSPPQRLQRIMQSPSPSTSHGAPTSPSPLRTPPPQLPRPRSSFSPPATPSRGYMSPPSTPASRRGSISRVGEDIPASWESLSPQSDITPALVYSPSSTLTPAPSNLPPPAATPALTHPQPTQSQVVTQPPSVAIAAATVAPQATPAPTFPTALQTTLSFISDSAKEIIAKISEGKSVTSGNKKRIKELAQSIMGAVEGSRNETPPELPKPVSDAVLHAIRETIRDELKGHAPTHVPTPHPAPLPTSTPPAPQSRSFATVAATSPPKRPSPMPRTQPAIIIKAKEAGDKQPDVYSEWRKNIKFRNTTFAPSKVRTLRNNTVKVNFDNAAQRDETLARVNEVPGIVAEKSKLRKPLIILKGVSKETDKDELLEIVASQNQVAAGDLRLCFLLKNRNDNLYNAVLEVAPAIRRAFVEEGRVNVEHQRVHVADFSRFVQCRKCLQFGHTGNKCSADFYPCGHCGSATHHITTCSYRTDATKMTCYNCKKANSTNTKHSALDAKSCPKILNALKSLNDTTDYGY
ncbi:uncharacterized protein LOC128683940 [Plodia interpunctella]|uniref:uncharacterized protein LOC128683940 n=1 Tax=Plodia interpunctella TaxID=58824 RepID=UPI002367823B|nr:uncharacterized protein LOC128683940 [Plodia interpunctella]